MKYKVKILKEPEYKEGGTKETVKKGMPSFLLYQIELAKKQIAKKGVPKVSVDKFGIATDQYGNKYYKPHGTNTYKLDPNQKGGYWSHVVKSAKDKTGETGWNESAYKKQEFSKMNELLNPFDSSPDKYSFTEELGSLFRSPQNSLNALLTNNYEPMSVSRRRYTDPKFDPNSGWGIALDVVTDPMIFPEIPYFLGRQSVRGLNYVAPILADYALVAGKYIGKKAKIVSELALKYGKKTAQYVVENAPELYDKVSRFKYALNKGGNEIEDQNDAYQKAVLQYSNPQQNPFVKQNVNRTNQQAMPANYQQFAPQQFPSQQFFAPQVGPNVMQPSSYKRTGSMSTNPTINSRNVQQQNLNNNEEQVLQYRGGNKNSLVDLLKYNDMDSSMASRKKLAEEEYGIDNYTGTYEQNVKLKNLLQNKYQDGGGMEEEGSQEQILQIIQAYAEAAGVDPRELMTKLQSLGEEEQQQAITQMYQSLQGGNEGGQEEQQGYAQEQMQPGMQQQMGYGEEEEDDDTQMAAYGGQMGYGLDLGSRRLWMNQDDDEQSMVNRSIKEVPRDLANIEAEGGETALVPNKNDNGHSHFNIQGNRHTNGGVPLNVPEGTFIYSDTKKMKLGGSVLSVFGKSDKTNKKYTPAALAKQYNLNKYTAILESSKSSQLERRTAELMIQNYNKKLAQLALVQEGKKGYPQGIPKVAEEYYAKTKAYVEKQQTSKLPNNNRMQYGGEDFNQDMEEDEQMQAMYGMGFKYGGGLQRFQGDVDGSEYKGIPYSYDKPPLTQDDLLGNYTTENNNQGIVNSDNNYFYKTLTTPTYASLGIKMPANKYSGFGMQNTKNYDDPNLIGIDLGMQKDRNYLPEEDRGVFKLGLQKPYNAETTEDDDKKKEEEAVDKSNLKYGWTNPDKLNLLNSYINLASVRKSTPFEPTTKFERNITMYADPARALAANTEQYNAARQASAMFAGPQSRYSLNAGQYGKNAADIIGQYANQNIQTGNIAANQAADTNNKQMLYDAQRSKRLYDAGVISEQQYQNAMRQARAGVLQAYTQGTKNATDLYNMSMSESPYYDIDASRGAGLMRFVKGKEANYFAQKANDNSNSDYAAMTKAGYTNFDDWAKSLGYASYDQLMKARVANAKMAAGQK